jgi:hypothetical protein
MPPAAAAAQGGNGIFAFEAPSPSEAGSPLGFMDDCNAGMQAQAYAAQAFGEMGMSIGMGGYHQVRQAAQRQQVVLQQFPQHPHPGMQVPAGMMMKGYGQGLPATHVGHTPSYAAFGGVFDEGFGAGMFGGGAFADGVAMGVAMGGGRNPHLLEEMQAGVGVGGYAHAHAHGGRFLVGM